MTPTEWKAKGAYFDYQGHQLFFRKEAQAGKPWIVLIHGFPTASWDWHAVWQLLSPRFSLAAIDMLGFGFSDKPRQHDYSIMEQADIHEAFLATQGITSYHILAHDYGDTVAQELLARHQERSPTPPTILSCCFLNGGLFPEYHRPVLIQRLLLSPIGFLLSAFLGKPALTRNFNKIFGPNTCPSDQEVDHFWSLIEHKGGKYVFYRLIRYITDRQTHQTRWVNILSTTTVPLKLINGPEDTISGRHAAEVYQARVPNADLTMLEGIGHYPNVEAPEAVVEGYLEFLGSKL